MPRKKRQQQFDPDDAVRTAEVHLRAAMILFDAFPKQVQANQIQTVASAIVLSALGVEIYIKALIKKLTGRSASGHDLWTLFRMLPRHSREAIEGRYDAYVEQSPLVKAMREQFGDDHPGDELKKCLIEAQFAFERWRYVYEPQGGGSYRNMGSLIEALRAHYRELP